MSGCVCSVPVDQCVPVQTTTWQTTARVWRDRALRSHHSVSVRTYNTLKYSHRWLSSKQFSTWVVLHSDSLYKVTVHHGIPPSAAPPSGPCDIQCQNGGSCFLNARQVAKCRCQPSYTGERCEINQCRDYCKNGGTCTASHTGKNTTTHT